MSDEEPEQDIADLIRGIDQIVEEVAEGIRQEVAVMAEPRFKAVPRTNDELVGLSALVRREQRDTMIKDRLQKYHEAAVSTLPVKFSLLTMSDDKDKLKNPYNIMRRNQDFFNRLDKFDMAVTFTEVLLFNNDDLSDARKNLRENYTNITIDEIRKSNRYYNMYGQDYDVQDLGWTQELLENSCEPSLRDKVMEKITLYPRDEQGGPLFYRIMMELITTTTDQATRTMITRITNMKIRDIAGEDISQAVSSIRGALRHLTSVNSVPHDFRSILIDTFKKTSVPEFNDIFNVLTSNIRLNSNYDVSIEKVLETAEATYHEMKERGIWNAPTQARGLVTCWNCSEEGHSAHDCPKPRNEETIKKNRDKFDGGRGSGRGGRSGGRSGRGRGYGRGRGGGRGGNGRGSSSNMEQLQKDPLKTPPTKKGLTTLDFNGVRHIWCHKCGGWNTNHLTNAHPDHAARTTTASSTTPATTTQATNVAAMSGSFRETIFHGTIFHGTRGAN
jgi:uncharacterized membrane protein YgcG